MLQRCRVSYLKRFFPQDVERENKQDFIKVDQSMLDKVIKKCYSYNKKYPDTLNILVIYNVQTISNLNNYINTDGLPIMTPSLL